MRFHEHEEKRRRGSAALVLLFVASVVGTALGVYFAAAVLVHLARLTREPAEVPFLWWNGRLFLWTTGGTLALVLAGTAHMARLLSGGGAVVAERLGGRPIPLRPTDESERRARNVVEEIAIASGVPVPDLYLLERESSVNAFAAGRGVGDGAIALTRGAVELLSRDELQGVVAHEMSHLLNGDTRLNHRLSSLLHGVLLLGQMGVELCRVALTPSGSGGEKKSPIFLVFPGAALAAVGYVGLFFGRCLKGGVSRQREFLADASAVRLTRNPRGLAGALKKIGGLVEGSRLRGRRAEEVSHMAFGAAIAPPMLGLGRTHPPLVERIRAIEPGFLGTFERVAGLPVLPEEVEEESHAWTVPAPPAGFSVSFGMHAAEFVSQSPSPAHVERARSFLAGVPKAIEDAARDRDGAPALAFALLLDRDPAVRERQLVRIGARFGAERAIRASALADEVARLGSSARLPLLDLALPALRRMDAGTSAAFVGAVGELVDADGAVTLFELALGRALDRRVSETSRRPVRRAAQYYALTPLLPDCATLLSAVARAGHGEPAAAAAAFAVGAGRLTTSGLAFAPACGGAAVGDSLDRLASAVPRIRERVLDACAFAAAQDGVVSAEEAEVLRAVADALDLPLPPFVRG